MNFAKWSENDVKFPDKKLKKFQFFWRIFFTAKQINVKFRDKSDNKLFPFYLRTECEKLRNYQQKKFTINEASYSIKILPVTLLNPKSLTFSNNSYPGLVKGWRYFEVCMCTVQLKVGPVILQINRSLQCSCPSSVIIKIFEFKNWFWNFIWILNK